MLISKMKNMGNFVLQIITIFYIKNKIWCFFISSIFIISIFKKLMLIRLLTTILSLLGLTFSNYMLALLTFLFFCFITYLLLLNEFIKNENKYFLDFLKKICGFSTQFLKKYLTPFCGLEWQEWGQNSNMRKKPIQCH